jgi:uncharacterized protein YjiS (DUF1127 family)
MNTRTETFAPRVATSVRKRGALNTLATAWSLWHERRALKRLDAAGLDDIGRTAREAAIEARRPVWDAPSRWFL